MRYPVKFVGRALTSATVLALYMVADESPATETQLVNEDWAGFPVRPIVKILVDVLNALLFHAIWKMFLYR